MKKIRLDIDPLEVTSFATAPEPAARGTVQGHVGTPVNTCYVDTCNASCDIRCRPVTYEPTVCAGC